MALGRVISIPSALICLPGGKHIQRPADDIHSGIDSQRDSGRHIQLLHAPGHLIGDAGVAVHISLKSHLLPQKPLYEDPVKRKAYRLHLHGISVRPILGLALGSRWFGIIRHDGGCLFVYGCPEGRQVVCAQAVLCLVHIPLSLDIVGVESVFPGSASREMLDGDGHPVPCDSLAASLYAGNQTLHDGAHKLRILAKGSIGPLPPGICHDIGHVHISLFHPHCIPFHPDTPGKAVYEFRSVSPDSRRDSHGPGPGGKHACLIVHAEYNLPVLIPGIGKDHHRQGMAGSLRHHIKLVNPVRQFARPGVLTQDEMAYAHFLYRAGGSIRIFHIEDGLVLLHNLLVEKAAFIHLCPVLLVNSHLPGVDEQHADFLVSRQFRRQGSRPFGGSVAPILIGSQPSIPCQVPEIQPVLFDHRLYGNSDDRTVFIFIKMNVS